MKQADSKPILESPKKWPVERPRSLDNQHSPVATFLQMIHFEEDYINPINN